MADCWKKILRTQQQLTLIEYTLYALKMQHDEELAQVITGLGYNYIAPLEDREEYLRQIYTVEFEAKILIVFLNQYTAEYKKLSTDNDLDKEMERTAMDYEKELAILSKFVGFRLKKEEITVMEFASYVNVYLDSNRKIEE